MNRPTLRLGLLTIVLCLLASASLAEAAGFARVSPHQRWDRIFAGTRSEAMGQADLAVSQGPMSIFDNPAPLPEGRGLQVGYGHLDYLDGLWFNQYALAAEFGAFRLGYARMDFGSEDMPIRTAFNPEGSGETFQLGDRVRIAAGSLDIAALLAPGSPWQWTVGVAHREYRGTNGTEITHTKGLDFGSSARYQHRMGGARVTASLAGVLRNINDDKYVPEDSRLGLGLSLALDEGQQPDVVVLTLAYLFKDVRTDDKYFGDRHYGAELTLLQILSLRIGHDEQIFGGTDQFGLGVVVPRQWIKPFGLSVDWGAAGTGTIQAAGITDEDSFHMVTVTGSYDF